MKGLWKRKWLVVAATLVIFLSVGTVAWATSGGAETPAAPAAADSEEGILLASTAFAEDEVAAAERPGAAVRQAMRERREERIKHHQALMQLLREKMTPEDQVAYDRLVQEAKDQRTALQQAREDLAGTLKELRELADKYLDETAADSSSAGATVQ